MKRSLDLVLALIVTIVSAVIAERSYIAMLEMEGPSHVLFSAVDLGPSFFHVMSAERCIGELSTNLSEDQGLVFRANGNLRSVYGKTSSEAAITIIASFNPLGQLTDSGSDVLAPNVHINLRTTNINPMRLIFDARVGERAVSQEFSAPGPVLIKKVQMRTYRIEYSGLRSSHGGILQILGDNVRNEIGAKLIRVPESEQHCPAERRSAFDVASLMLKSRGLEKFIQRFLPDALP